VTRPSKKVSPREPGAALKVTENQRSILLRLFAGGLEREIAAETGRHATTIFNTVLRVRAQLGARTEYDLMRECVRREIVTLDEIYALADAIRPPAAERSPDELG
jgi:DNA-binding NarL/FixJ family response regulator